MSKTPMTRIEKINRAIFVRKKYGNLKAAEKLVRSAMRSLKTEPNRDEARKILTDGFEQLGLINFARGRNGRALWYFNQAIRLAKDVDGPKTFNYERLLSIAAEVHIARGRYDLADEMYAEAIVSLLKKGVGWLASAILKIYKEFLKERNRKKEASACQRKIRALELKFRRKEEEREKAEEEESDE